ncbi:MAG TPA: MFS transporter [Micromonosporaceae bacterium]|nr:MFS transporter [Micromonosporaceae bacterium]
MSLRARLGILTEFDFRQLFVADTVSQLGTMVTQLALPLVAVLALHATPFEVGLLAAADTAAFLLVGLPAGAWVDRLRRRSVMISGDLARAILLGSVPFAWWMGWLSMAQLYVVGLGTGLATVFFDVAYQSYLPHLVGRENLVEGNAKLQGVQSVSQLAGPTAAGFLIQAMTAPYAIVVDAVSFVGSALFVSRIRSREAKPERGPDAHFGREIAEGFNFVVRNKILRSIAACTGSSNLFSAISGAMLILLLAGHLHIKAGLIGVVFTFMSIGGLVGALTARRFAAWVGQGPAIWLSIGLTAPFALLTPFVHNDWRLWTMAFGNAMYWLGAVVYNVNQVSFRQAITPDRLLGRMNATMRFLVWGTLPLGGFIGGILGATIGVRNTIWVGAIGGLFSFLFVFFSPARWARELPGGDAATEPAGADATNITDIAGTAVLAAANASVGATVGLESHGAAGEERTDEPEEEPLAR